MPNSFATAEARLGRGRSSPRARVILVASVRDLKLHSHPWCESQPVLCKDLEIHESSVLRMAVLEEKLNSGHKWRAL